MNPSEVTPSICSSVNYNKMVLPDSEFSVSFWSSNLGCHNIISLTEQERGAFDALYGELPSVLKESISELNSMLELRSKMDRYTKDPSQPLVKYLSNELLHSSARTQGRRYTERGEQLLRAIERPLPSTVWNQLLSFDSSFMGSDRLRLYFVIGLMRKIWSSPVKRKVLSNFLALKGIDESSAISIDRMFPYFVYHQIAINSISMSTNSQYHISFLRIPQGAKYEFVFTDNPAIEFCEESKFLWTNAINRFLWIISPTSAVMMSDKIGGKTRFVNEREADKYNALLLKKSPRYMASNRNNDFLPNCS